jgi:hypothetical protein
MTSKEEKETQFLVLSAALSVICLLVTVGCKFRIVLAYSHFPLSFIDNGRVQLKTFWASR